MDKEVFNRNVIEAVESIRRESTYPTGACPFYTFESRCSTYCSTIFPQWAVGVRILKSWDGKEWLPDNNHPCSVLGKEVVLATMKKKFPELYTED